MGQQSVWNLVIGIIVGFAVAWFLVLPAKIHNEKANINDDAQIRLKEYCDRINEAGFHFMLSNSDCKGKNENDNFFDVLFQAYQIERVWASRSINSNPNKRGKLTEILVRNYLETKNNAHSDIFHFYGNASEQLKLALAVNQ